VAQWQVLAGPSPTSLSYVTSARRTGFETAIVTRTKQPYVVVRAVSKSHQVLGVSRAIAR
jgi:hypothetical protein